MDRPKDTEMIRKRTQTITLLCCVQRFVCVWCGLALLLWATLGCGQTQSRQKKIRRVPIIDVTDLYQPFQDSGDNFDLLTAYALPEVELKAVILDAHDSFRTPVSHHPILHDSDKNGPRDPGFIPVLQLNYIFNRNVPAAAGPFTMMKSPAGEPRACHYSFLRIGPVHRGRVQPESAVV